VTRMKKTDIAIKRIDMVQVLNDIDEVFGKGTAKKHPDLVAAYMLVVTGDDQAGGTS